MKKLKHNSNTAAGILSKLIFFFRKESADPDGNIVYIPEHNEIPCVYGPPPMKPGILDDGGSSLKKSVTETEIQENTYDPEENEIADVYGPPGFKDLRRSRKNR